MEEPSALIRWAIFVFAGGDSAIWGAVGIALIAFADLYPFRAWSVRPFHLWAIIVVGVILIVCGSPPVPVWFCIATAIWLAVILYNATFRVRGTTFGAKPSSEWRLSVAWRMWMLGPLLWFITAITIELPFRLWFPPTGRISRLLVIGDSVTAGLNDGEDTWPRQLSRAVKVEVLDASQPGATLRSAKQQNARFSDQSGTVILEIGGNDMLEGLPVNQFEHDLDQLLTAVCQPDRTVVMFELPLPPLCARYGASQRRQAARHQVTLVPKRNFAAVLTTQGSTVDGIHLSEQGQTRVMALVRKCIHDNLDSGAGQYQRVDPARGESSIE